MNRISIFFIISFLFTTSCSSHKQEVLSLKEIENILYDIYLTTAILEFEDISAIYSSKDTTSIYFDIYTAHGYSRELVENSMKYYFIKKTNKISNIYNKIISDMETEIANISNAAAKEVEEAEETISQ